MKFAVWILIVLAVVSLISMFIVEFYPININIDDWKGIYSERYGWFFPVMRFLQLQDPYRSWWYQALLGILALSLALCLIDRLPKGIRLFFCRTVDFSSENINRYAEHCSLKTSSDFFDRLPQLLRGYTVHIVERDGVQFFAAVRGRISHFGPILTHSGLLLLVIGGLLAIWGVSTFSGGYPGDIIESPKFDFKVRIDDFKIVYYPLGVGQWVLVDDEFVGKTVRKLSGEKFLIRFYTQGKYTTEEVESSRLRNKFDYEADRGSIKDYISELTIIEDGEEILTRSIEVNKPLRYKGVRFYQNSYDLSMPKITASADSAVIQVAQKPEGIVLDTMNVPLDERVRLPDGTEMLVTDFLPDFKWSGDGAFSASGDMRNPAVELRLFDGDQELYHQWLFLFHDFHGRSGDERYSFRLLNLTNPQTEADYRTILEIKENYGYALIWAGFILGTLGLIFSFYFTPRFVRGIAQREGDGWKVSLGGYSRRDKVQFSREFERIIDRVK
ncbi:MAG: cytochrome c biogenesis protein ResB [candidate division Zixibacteria bacterium]|nr:cytochrome c biogenesis protein ResB [Candidatus Tariuqbacter arcticus]